MSDHEICITVIKRDQEGKGANKRYRKQGKVPGILYGHGIEPLSLLADAKTLQPIIGHPSIITLNIDQEEGTRKVLIKDVQIDYLTSRLIHIDLQQVRMDEEITAEIPFELIGTPIGLKHGGMLDQTMHTIEVECLPQDLPDRIVYDVSHLDVGAGVTIEELPLPTGVKAVYTDPLTIAVHVIRSKLAEESESGGLSLGESGAAEPEIISKGKKETEASKPEK